jgi:hypothetical protein
MVAFTNWQTDELDPQRIQLDPQNPRIEGEGLTQSQIRELLLRSENVDELAKQIVDAGGLFPHDQIIVVEELGSHVVLEGNRRICAIQLLLKPSLVPADLRSRFPKNVNQEAIDAIKSVDVLVAPTRQEADPIIARIHTFPSRKSWQPLAKMRYANKHYAETNDIDEVAERLSTNPSSVRKLIRR